MIEVVLYDTTSLPNGDNVWHIDVQSSLMKKEELSGYKSFVGIANLLNSDGKEK